MGNIPSERPVFNSWLKASWDVCPVVCYSIVSSEDRGEFIMVNSWLICRHTCPADSGDHQC